MVKVLLTRDLEVVVVPDILVVVELVELLVVLIIPVRALMFLAHQHQVDGEEMVDKVVHTVDQVVLPMHDSS